MKERCGDVAGAVAIVRLGKNIAYHYSVSKDAFEHLQFASHWVFVMREETDKPKQSLTKLTKGSMRAYDGM